jgi:hypothetical protein
MLARAAHLSSAFNLFASIRALCSAVISALPGRLYYLGLHLMSQLCYFWDWYSQKSHFAWAEKVPAIKEKVLPLQTLHQILVYGLVYH